jgi:hypothetical protein
MSKKIIIVLIILVVVIGIFFYFRYRRSQSLLYTVVPLTNEFNDVIDAGTNPAPLTDPSTKLCQPSEMPPCKDGFRELPITQNNEAKGKPNETSICCVPNRPTGRGFQIAETMIYLAEAYMAQYAFDSVVLFVSREIYLRASMLTPRGVANLRVIAANQFNKQAALAAKSVAGKAATSAAVKAAQVKITTALAQRQLALKSIQLSTKIGRMAATSAIGPIGWILNAVQIAGMILDFGDPAGYEKKQTSEMFRDKAATANSVHHDNLRASNNPSPLIIGPFLDLPVHSGDDNLCSTLMNATPENGSHFTQSELKKFPMRCLQSLAVSEFIAGYTNAVVNTPGIEFPTNPDDITILYDELQEQALKKLESPDGTDWALQRMCESVGGKYIPGETKGTGQCSYTTEDECNKSYDWNEIKKSMNDVKSESTERYAEWRNKQCQDTSVLMRSNCDDQGLVYDVPSQTCIITPEYCQSQSIQYVSGQDGLGDCKLSDIQNAMEMIFGKTITRAIITAFERPDVAARWLLNALADPANSIGSVLDFIAVASGGAQGLVITIGDYVYNFLHNVPVIGTITDFVYLVVNGYGSSVIVAIGDSYNNASRNAMTTINLIDRGFSRAGAQCNSGQVGACLQTSFETAGQAIVSGAEGIIDNIGNSFKNAGNVLESWAGFTFR